MTGEQQPTHSLLFRERVTQTAWSALIGGGLLLLFGLYYLNTGLTGVSDSALYNAFVGILVWTLVAGGVLNLASASLLFTGWRQALVTDTVISIGTGGMLILIGLVRILHHLRIGSIDLQGILLLIFGGMFVRSGLGSWHLHSGMSAPRETERTAPAAAPAQASVEGQRESARERLLRAKADLRGAVAAAPKSADHAGPDSPPGQRDGLDATGEANAAPVLSAPAKTGASSHEQEKRVQASEPVEGGFLAELGRSEDDERR